MVGFFSTHGSHLFDAKLYRSCSSDKHGLRFSYLLLICFALFLNPDMLLL